MSSHGSAPITPDSRPVSVSVSLWTWLGFSTNADSRLHTFRIRAPRPPEPGEMRGPGGRPPEGPNRDTREERPESHLPATHHHQQHGVGVSGEGPCQDAHRLTSTRTVQFYSCLTVTQLSVTAYRRNGDAPLNHWCTCNTVTPLQRHVVDWHAMTPEPGDGERPRVAAAVPTNHKQVLDYAADQRSSPGNRAYTAEIVREAIEEWIHRHASELPEEARDLLDDDLLANAGGEEVSVEIGDAQEVEN